MPMNPNTVTRSTHSIVLTDEAPVVFYGWGRLRETLGDEQTCYNAPKWNGVVDGVFLGDVTVTRIHRHGNHTGWFSIREHGAKKRTFYVRGDMTSFEGMDLNGWWAKFNK